MPDEKKDSARKSDRVIYPVTDAASRKETTTANCSFAKHYDPESSSVSSAGKPLFSSAASASATTKAVASPETVAVNSPALMLTSATPGSDCRAFVTVARHPPQVMPGQVNFASTTAFSVAAADAPDSEAVGLDTGCSAHPAAATTIRHNSCFRIVFHLNK